MTLTQILLSVSAQLDSLLVGKVAGASELGLYRQADNLMKAPVERFNAPIATVSQSGLSILQREPARYRRYYQRILLVVSLLTVPLGVFTAIYAHEIILIVLGQKWLGATVFLRIFALLASIRPAMATSAVVMITCGHAGRFLKVSLVYSAALVTLMLIGISWGSVGIASAHLATAVLVTPWLLSYSFAGSPVSIRAFGESVSRPAIASLTMGAALLLLQSFANLESALLSLALGAGTAITVYFLTLNLLPGGRDQLQSLAKELLGALRRRSSAEVEANKGEGAAH
jgi:PST family polysaccharide transporter